MYFVDICHVQITNRLVNVYIFVYTGPDLTLCMFMYVVGIKMYS